jgi:hypothetical protein
MDKRIDHLKNIDTDTVEGRLLVCAISKLAVFMPGQGSDQIIKKLNELNDKIYYDAYTANDNRQRDPRPFLEATNGRTNEARKDGNEDLVD